jgi:hypothetical protein
VTHDGAMTPEADDRDRAPFLGAESHLRPPGSHLGRRAALGLLGGFGLATLLGCSGGTADPPPSAPASASSARSTSAGRTRRDRFVTGVSARHFVDQRGDPILVKGDSPWSAFVDLTTSEWETWCASREGHGFNAAIVSLVGATGNGGPSSDGSTFDGIRPFTDGDVTNPDEGYWSRVDTFVQTAQDHGITLFLYAIDGWTVLGGESFDGVSEADCETYGAWLASRYSSAPNIVWMFGGDYPGEPTQDLQMSSCLSGIRSTGDTRPVSCQMIYHRSWPGQYDFWAPKVDFQHIYSYPVQYDAVYAVHQSETNPPLFMEGYYGGENDGSDLTVRKQAGWAMTQGSPGHFYGSDDWELPSGWESRLDAYGVSGVAAIHTYVESTEWWRLEPSRTLIASGAGTPLDASGVGVEQDTTKDPSNSTFATAGVSSDGTLALCYLPSRRAITLNLGELGGSPRGVWVNALTGATTSVDDLSGPITPPASGDWLLHVTAG